MPDEPTRLLKANAIRSLGSKVVFNYEDIHKRCDDYVEKVRQDTRRMIEDASVRAESIKRGALEEGRRAGREQGLRDAEEEIQTRSKELADQLAIEKLKTSLPAMEAATAKLLQARDQWLSAWEKTAVELSLAVAGKLIHKKLEANPELSTEMIRGVLELAAGIPRIHVRLNPDDIQQMGDHAAEIVRSLASCGEAILVPDDAVSHGGCVVETRHGVIDGNLETQLERIASELVN